MNEPHLPYRPELLDPAISGQEPPPIPWLVRDLLPAGTLLEWAADPKTGKSFLALDLALAVITGQPFLGLAVERPGHVVYFDEENSRAVLWQRAYALAKGRGITSSDQRLHFYRFQCVGRRLQEWVPKAVAVTAHWQPTLVVFDTLIKFSGGPLKDKENDSSLMQAVCSGFRRVAQGETALFLHHLSKQGKSPRGSSILIGDPDGVWKITRPGGRPRGNAPLPPIILAPTESRLIDVTEPRKVTAVGTKRSMVLTGEVCTPPKEDDDGTGSEAA